jgi:glycosyltransferase involved in cell wall biosynthesis
MLRFYDKKTTDRVDLFVANSRYVAERVKRLYGRHADVLHPPVDTKRFRDAVREPEEWYLVVSALVPYKRVDLAIRACSRLGRSLKVVGQGPEMGSLTSLAAELGADVELIGFASDEMLVEHYRRAKALLFPGIEDFGIVPVEAIACGCPVIALGTGGIIDSMTEKTAIFYNEATVEGLTAAMTTFEKGARVFNTAELRAQADQFSETHFLRQFSELLSKVEQTIGLAERKNQESPIRLAVPQTRVESAETAS